MQNRTVALLAGGTLALGAWQAVSTEAEEIDEMVRTTGLDRSTKIDTAKISPVEDLLDLAFDEKMQQLDADAKAAEASWQESMKASVEQRRAEEEAARLAAEEAHRQEHARAAAEAHAEQHRRAEARAQARTSSHTHTRTETSNSGGNTGGHLASIRQCESGGDYGAVSPSGKYRGAYQFDQQTWESVGGSGDPANASPAEQDTRAQELKNQRGSSPWPNCG